MQAIKSFSDLCESDYGRNFISLNSTRQQKDFEKISEKTIDASGRTKNSHKMPDTRIETRQTGSIQTSSYAVYFKSAGLFGPIVVLMLFAASQVLIMASDLHALSWSGFFYFYFPCLLIL
jgi:hypothetical protein